MYEITIYILKYQNNMLLLLLLMKYLLVFVSIFIRLSNQIIDPVKLD